MHLVAHTQDLLDLAHAHLEDGAAAASTGFATQIDLAAALLPAPRFGRRPATDPSLTLAENLEAALSALDAIEPADGPADLQLCAWHIHELRRIQHQGLAS